MNYRVWLLLLLMWLPGWALASSCSLLIVGDSLSSGYGLAPGQGWVDRLDARLKKAAPQWRVVNASVSGDTTQNGLQRLKPALDRHRPQGVLIELGGNDALRGTPPAVIRQNLQAMVRQAKASGAWVAAAGCAGAAELRQGLCRRGGEAVWRGGARGEDCPRAVFCLRGGCQAGHDAGRRHPPQRKGARPACSMPCGRTSQPKLRCPAK